MRSDDESEIEISVASRVASVTIESDSQPNNLQAESRIRRRRKRYVKRPPKEKMDVDVCMKPVYIGDPSTAAYNERKCRMEWDEVWSGSELSSSDAHSSDGREADDEESDWVDSADMTSHLFQVPQLPSNRSVRLSRAHASRLFLQRKLERFLREDSQRELVLSHWTRSDQISRLLHCFGLEVARRNRGTVVLKKVK